MCLPPVSRAPRRALRRRCPLFLDIMVTFSGTQCCDTSWSYIALSSLPSSIGTHEWIDSCRWGLRDSRADLTALSQAVEAPHRRLRPHLSRRARSTRPWERAPTAQRPPPSMSTGAPAICARPPAHDEPLHPVGLRRRTGSARPPYPRRHLSRDQAQAGSQTTGALAPSRPAPCIAPELQPKPPRNSNLHP
jgi:hypothetical protein